MEYNVVQCSTVPCNSGHYSVSQFSAVQCNAVQYSAVQCSDNTVKINADRGGLVKSVADMFYSFSPIVLGHLLSPGIYSET